MDVPKGDRREEWSWSTTEKVVEKQRAAPFASDKTTAQAIKLCFNGADLSVQRHCVSGRARRPRACGL